MANTFPLYRNVNGNYTKHDNYVEIQLNPNAWTYTLPMWEIGFKLKLNYNNTVSLYRTGGTNGRKTDVQKEVIIENISIPGGTINRSRCNGKIWKEDAKDQSEYMNLYELNSRNTNIKCFYFNDSANGILLRAKKLSRNIEIIGAYSRINNVTTKLYSERRRQNNDFVEYINDSNKRNVRFILTAEGPNGIRCVPPRSFETTRTLITSATSKKEIQAILNRNSVHLPKQAISAATLIPGVDKENEPMLEMHHLYGMDSHLLGLDTHIPPITTSGYKMGISMLESPISENCLKDNGFIRE